VWGVTPLKTINNGFSGKLFSYSAKIFEWLGIKSNGKNVDKFTKITGTVNKLRYIKLIMRKFVKSGMSGKFFDPFPLGKNISN
jgi:hypothetical protein